MSHSYNVDLYLTGRVAYYIPRFMTETEQLISRIHALSEKTGKATTTLSAAILGSGHSLQALEGGKTITLAKYEKALATIAEMERGLAA